MPVNVTLPDAPAQATNDAPSFSRYSRGGDAATQGMSNEEIERGIRAFESRLGRTLSEMGVVRYISPTETAAFGPAFTGQAKAAFYPRSKRLVLIASRLSGPRDLQTTLRHELLAHYGIHLFTPEQKRALLDRLTETRGNPLFRSAWGHVDGLYPDASEDVKAEERVLHGPSCYTTASCRAGVRSSRNDAEDLMTKRKTDSRTKGRVTRRAAPERRPIGRPPTKPSPDDAQAVGRLCELLIGGMSMTEACAQDDCPARTAVYAKMAADEDFRRVIARAREAQQHAMIDETIEMADAATPENWQVVKLRIWARQWRAAKLAPRVYGDKVEVAGSAENPLTLLIQEVQGRALKPIQIIPGEAEEE